MKWIELIALRSIYKDREMLEHQIQELTDEVNRETKSLEITLYKRTAVETDVGIHILHNSGKVEDNGSQLGLRLADALKEFGLVNHSIWIKMNGK
jgi:hypothetical protein